MQSTQYWCLVKQSMLTLRRRIYLFQNKAGWKRRGDFQKDYKEALQNDWFIEREMSDVKTNHYHNTNWMRWKQSCNQFYLTFAAWDSRTQICCLKTSYWDCRVPEFNWVRLRCMEHVLMYFENIPRIVHFSKLKIRWFWISTLMLSLQYWYSCVT